MNMGNKEKTCDPISNPFIYVFCALLNTPNHDCDVVYYVQCNL